MFNSTSVSALPQKLPILSHVYPNSERGDFNLIPIINRPQVLLKHTHLPSSHFQQGHRDINWPKCKFKLPVFLHLGVGRTSGDDECAFNTSTQFRVIN